MNDILSLQTLLAASYGPSGRETAIAAGLRKLAEPYADEVQQDSMGNLIVHKKGNGKKIMLSAHMDSLGVMVTHIDENGFLRFAALGGIGLYRVIGTVVEFPNGVKGIICAESSVEPCKLKPDNLYLDIGANSHDNAREMVNVGDVAVYSARTFVQNGKLFSTYLDNRIGCAILLRVLAELQNPKNDLYFVFSAQEEVGCRGAKTAAFGIQPDYALAVDVTGTGDMPEAKPKLNVRLGGGAAIKIADKNIISHPRVIRWLEETAARHEIPVQREVANIGGTDAGVMQRAAEGAYAGGVTIPTRHIHGTLEMAAMCDIEACERLLCAALDADLS